MPLYAVASPSLTTVPRPLLFSGAWSQNVACACRVMAFQMAGVLRMCQQMGTWPLVRMLHAQKSLGTLVLYSPG